METLSIGFTGTSNKLTSKQEHCIIHLFSLLNAEVTRVTLHHGDCIGADAFAHREAMRLGWNVVLHPPTNPRKRAWCKGWVISKEPKPYLYRNQCIARECELLTAAPAQELEVMRSGTWATVRYARTYNREILIINPSGTIKEEGLRMGIYELFEHILNAAS